MLSTLWIPLLIPLANIEMSLSLRWYCSSANKLVVALPPQIILLRMINYDWWKYNVCNLIIAPIITPFCMILHTRSSRNCQRDHTFHFWPSLALLMHIHIYIYIYIYRMGWFFCTTLRIMGFKTISKNI